MAAMMTSGPCAKIDLIAKTTSRPSKTRVLAILAILSRPLWVFTSLPSNQKDTTRCE
jgi:hypothetical protein